ncbi:MAG: helix-turn-helix transcriptional regulator [bacterium]|nr:helix-turn-helix transcriptional regulator [bacterium]
MKNFNNFKKEILKDKSIKLAYDDLGTEFEIIRLLTKRRIEKGLTQEGLAKIIGTKQSAIARLESGHYNPSLLFLNKIAHGLNTKIKIEILKTL